MTSGFISHFLQFLATEVQDFSPPESQPEHDITNFEANPHVFFFSGKILGNLIIRLLYFISHLRISLKNLID